MFEIRGIIFHFFLVLLLPATGDINGGGES